MTWYYKVIKSYHLVLSLSLSSPPLSVSFSRANLNEKTRWWILLLDFLSVGRGDNHRENVWRNHESKLRKSHTPKSSTENFNFGKSAERTEFGPRKFAKAADLNSTTRVPHSTKLRLMCAQRRNICGPTSTHTSSHGNSNDILGKKKIESYGVPYNLLYFGLGNFYKFSSKKRSEIRTL